MTSIPLLVEKSEYKQFTGIYLGNKTFFLNFFVRLSKSALNLEHFQKKMTLIAYVFLKLPTTKDVLW